MSDDHDLLIRLDEKLDGLLKALEAHLEASGQLHTRQGERLDALEQWRWKWVGAVGVAAFLISLFGTLVGRALGGQ